MRLTTLGDLLLDVIVRLDRPPTLSDDTAARTVVAPGGQAANVAAWAAHLGAAAARIVARRGDDDAGRLVSQALLARGVEVAGPVGGRTGIVVSLAAAGDRTMASDRGSSPDLSPHDLEASWFDCDVLHVSGYALAVEPMASAAAAAAEAARSQGALVSLDLSAAALAGEDFRRRARALGADVVFATEREREAVGRLDARWVVKRGRAGVTVDGREWAAAPAEVVDTTGAGDALAAGFLLGGPELGLEAAARCCGRVGAQP